MMPSRLGLERGLRFSHFLFVMPELYSALGLLCFVLTLCSGLGTHLLMALPKVNDNLIRWIGTLVFDNMIYRHVAVMHLVRFSLSAFMF